MATQVTTRSVPRRRSAKLFFGILGGLAAIGLLAAGIGTGVCAQSFSAWLGYLITGFRLGVIYAMIALGYTMVYGVLQLLNFAHSEVFMVGSFAGLYAMSKIFGVGDRLHSTGVTGPKLWIVLFVGLTIAAVASATVAVLMERIAYRPLRRKGASRLAYLITAIGVSLFLSNLFQLLDGKSHLSLPFNWPRIGGAAPVNYPNVMNPTKAFSIFGVTVNNIDLLIIGVALAMFVALDQFVRRTQVGRGIRAVAEDPDTARLMGVNVDGIIIMTFLVGGAMAGVAGGLYGLYIGQAQFNMGFIPGIKAFTAAVLGGIGNIRGAMLGGILLGIIENVGVACTGIRWQQVIAFMVLVLVLMFRPTGILGERVGG